MKTIVTVLISFLSISMAAQEVTITFSGGANKNRGYRVAIDGVNYYSANSVSNNKRQMTTISNLAAGSHTLDVYVLADNSDIYSDGSTNNTSSSGPVYSKTFQLRDGYDMNISVRGNGLVSFTEKRSQQQQSTQVSTVMNTTTFTKLLNSVKAKRYQSEKITGIRNALNASANYFSSAQVRQLLALITTESRKLELAKLSYSKVTDRDNFSSVYGVLASEASRDALDNYVVQQGGAITSAETNTAYATAMTTANFSKLLNKTKGYGYQADRIAEIKSALDNNTNYFSTLQIKQLVTLINAETERLPMVKAAYTKVVDKNNFNQLVDLFSVESNRNDLNSFIVSNGGAANNNAYRQAMSESSFATIYNKSRNHFFQKNVVNDVRIALNTAANSFSTEQVKQLLQLVVAEPSRLELAKLAYARVVDTVNFAQLVDLFTVQTYKNDLENFIRSKQ